jgi:hypothetical protein
LLVSLTSFTTLRSSAQASTWYGPAATFGIVTRAEPTEILFAPSEGTARVLCLRLQRGLWRAGLGAWEPGHVPVDGGGVPA